MTEPPTMSMNLLDLPNELLLQILSPNNGLSPDDIYHTAFVSHRLLSLALPLFLAAEGIKNPEYETSVYVLRWTREDLVSSARRPNVLSALNLSSSITGMQHFRCFFQDPDTKSLLNSLQHTYHLPGAITRVSQFISRLERIEKAEIYLIWDQYFVKREQKITDISFGDLKEWTKAFARMLNLIVERGCTSLTIQYDPAILPAFRFRLGGPMQKAISYLIPRDKEPAQLRWEFENLHGSDKYVQLEVDLAARLTPAAQVVQAISSLCIHSPALLLPPFIAWTTSLIRTQKSLTSISFACITFPQGIWATVLPAIADAASTRLTELKFYHNCPHLESQDLLNFIYSFPNLTHLSVDRTFRARFQQTKASGSSKGLFHSQLSSQFQTVPGFLRLMELRAPVELVSLLMGPSFDPSNPTSLPFPSLQALTVYPSSLLIHPPSYIKSILLVNHLLDAIRQRPFAPTLLLSLDAQMEFTDFRPVSRYIQNVNQHAEFQRALWETLSAHEIAQLTEHGPAPHIAFDHPTNVILYKFHSQPPDQTPRALCIWLKTLFPRVERLTFTCRLDAHPQQNVDMDDDDIRGLTKELRNICPTVRSLIVGDKQYKL